MEIKVTSRVVPHTAEEKERKARELAEALLRIGAAREKKEKCNEKYVV